MRKLYMSLLTISSLCLHAQEVVWQKDITSSTQNLLSGLTITLDQQYLVSGSSIGLMNIENKETYSNNSGYDFRLVKLNQQGQQIWEKYFGGDKDDFLTAITSTLEGGFFVAGNSFSNKSGNKDSENYGGSDIWMIKLSENGELEWQKTIGTKGDDEVAAAVQTTDLGFFVAGNTRIEEGFGSKDTWVIKLDKKGNVKHQVFLGGNGLDQIETIIPTKDGGCLVGIYSRSGRYEFSLDKNYIHTIPLIFTSEIKSNYSIDKIGKTEENYGEGDYWIVKLNKDGKVEWQRNYGGDKDDKIKVLSLTENGYLLSGESRSSASGNKSVDTKSGTDLWILAIDEQGNSLWQENHHLGEIDILMSADPIWDREGNTTRGFLLGGYSQSITEIDENDGTFWLLHIDKKGKEVWKKYVKGQGKRNVEKLVSAKIGTDGSYVLAGTTAEEIGDEDWKVVKLGDSEIKKMIEKKELRAYPNPASDYIYVEIASEFIEAELTVYDLGGKQIYKTKTNNPVTKINTTNLASGVYIVNIMTNTQKLSTKFIKY